MRAGLEGTTRFCSYTSCLAQSQRQWLWMKEWAEDLKDGDHTVELILRRLLHIGKQARQHCLVHLVYRHMSHVTCHMSHVTWHISHLTPSISPPSILTPHSYHAAT